MALTLSATVPTRIGYTFLGWSTSSTATSAMYQPGSTFSTNANTTLYAVWKQTIAPGDAELTEEQRAVADMNGDGEFDMRDAYALYRIASGGN